MRNDLIQQARALLAEMGEQAEAGTMIPRRVPDQIAAIDDLLAQAEAGEVAAVPPESGAAGDAGDDAQQQLAGFISLAVHDLRLPMTSIQGYSDMLEKQVAGPLNEMQAEFVNTIRSNVVRMNRLLTDVSALSKLLTGRLHLDLRMEMAKNVLLGAEKAMRPLAEEREQTLNFDVADGLPLLNVDPDRIGQALSGLIRNALLYSPKGSTVTVTASNDDGHLRVTVADQGIGLTEEDQAHLGEPFWRGDHDAVQSEKGHGLGYAVASGMIELMDGHMFYETEFEQGSTFGFTLPGMS